MMVFGNMDPAAVKATYRAMRSLHNRGMIQLRTQVLNSNDHESSVDRRHLIAQLPGFPVDGD